MSEENTSQQDAQAPGTTLKATQELLTRARAELGPLLSQFQPRDLLLKRVRMASAWP